jgi:preprotein translocase subunit SecE
MNSIMNYINDSITELRQVRWPTRQQAIRFSAVVIIFVAISSIFFGIIDIALSEIMKAILDSVI